MTTLAFATTPNLVVYGDTLHGVCDVPELAEGDYYVEVWGGPRAGHVIALTSEDSLLAWGNNGDGQCNIPDDLPSPPIIPISAAAGLLHSYVAFSNGSVEWWGNLSGSYGPSHPLWVTQVAVSMSQAIFLRENGTICTQSGTQLFPGESDWTYIAAGHAHFLAIKDDSTVVCWGDSTHGQCDVPSPNSGFVAVAGGYYHSVGLKADGSIVCWGSNFYGQCTVPAPNYGFVSVAAGEYHSVALKESGVVRAWGSNYYGQCDVDGMTGVEGIAAGASYSAAILPPPTGIDPSSGEGQGEIVVFVYPNPSSGCLDFLLPGGGVIEVYDISGRLVSSVNVPNSGSVSWEAPATGVFFASATRPNEDLSFTRFAVLR